MRRDILGDSLSSSSSSDSEDGGTDLPNGGFTVNESYARKFEHNKKREEKQRLEEKLGKETRKRKRDGAEESDSDDSTSESEDEGELDTEMVDAEMMATLNAIRSKDPRIYDENAKFYTATDVEDGDGKPKTKKEKPMHLQEYHRRNLLNGDTAKDEEDGLPLTYNQEQEQLKKSIVKEMHAAAEGSSDEAEGAQFLVAKEKSKKRKQKKEPVLDVESADKDPETFLSNFMSSRAWAYPNERNLVPFESDDDEEEQRADDYEQAYNMRFEDPAKSNEKLTSHARDMAARYSVRRDETNPRQKKRDADKAKKEMAKQELREEKARLRKLRIEDVEEKVRRIKRAAGLKSKNLQPEDWSRFVDEDWDDEQWEAEMQRKFGEEYYADEDVESGDDVAAEGKRKKPKKPKFDDDIDIKDIIPDFSDEDQQPAFSLSDEEEQDEPPPKSKKQPHKQQKADKQRAAKKERRIIESLVDNQLQLELDHSLPPSHSRNNITSPSPNPNNTTASNPPPTGFRYRATSPKSFGLTARDILMADDAELNQYAGLKKLAAFRDQEKKRKDQKHLGKKARLRRWRADVFGNEEGPRGEEVGAGKGEVVGGDRVGDEDGNDQEGGGVSIVEGGRTKKKRRRKNKAKVGEVQA